MFDHVLYTEASLRRNYQDLSFCPQNNLVDLALSRSRSVKALAALLPDARLTDAREPDAKQPGFFRSAFLPSEAGNLEQAALLVDEASGLSASINMDEHLVLRSGARTGNVQGLIDAVRGMEERLTSDGLVFAKDKQFGYLSYRPTLAGSGLTISLLLHLPMLHFLKQMRPLTESLREKGCMIRPMAPGRNPARLYVLFNASSQGLSDEAILTKVLSCLAMLADKEQAIRKKALDQKENGTVADQAWKSYGVLKYARRLSENEVLTHWNSLRIGVMGGAVPLSLDVVDDLLTYANDAPFKQEGAASNDFIFRRAQAVRRTLAGGT